MGAAWTFGAVALSLVATPMPRHGRLRASWHNMVVVDLVEAVAHQEGELAISHSLQISKPSCNQR